jgi:hypothetical protein
MRFGVMTLTDNVADALSGRLLGGTLYAAADVRTVRREFAPYYEAAR